MVTDLHNLVLQDIKDCSAWASKQALYETIRYEGLRRRHKPYPGAADLHYPLVDGIIDKLKPYYYQQIFATQVVAKFVGKDSVRILSDVEWWFDYQLRHNSNFETEALIAIDFMLQSGCGVIKAVWDATEKRLRFSAFSPLYLIVPQNTCELSSADRVVHVQHMSRQQYAHGPGHNVRRQDTEFVGRITGRLQDDPAGEARDNKASREGITHSSNPDTIVLWEVYERGDAGTWKVHTYSPQAPDEPVREMFKIDAGEFPFVAFVSEITDGGWFSPRGVSELGAPFQASIVKMWNGKHDWMDFSNRPLLTCERDIPNPSAVRFAPGSILPYGIQRVDFGQPPVSFDQEIVSTRMVAEQRIGMPDFGTGQQINTRERKTATEIQAIGAVMGQSVDLRGRIFRLALAKLYNLAWRLLSRSGGLEFTYRGVTQKLGRELLSAVSALRPSGSSESWNLAQRQQRAIQRKALFQGSPWVDQVELDRCILELDEPDLVERLIRDPGFRERDNAQEQLREIPALMLGLPVEPRPDDDHATHAAVTARYMAQMAATNAPASPQALQAFQAHLQGHLQALAAQNPRGARDLGRQIDRTMKEISQRQIVATEQQLQGGIPSAAPPAAVAA